MLLVRAQVLRQLAHKAQQLLGIMRCGVAETTVPHNISGIRATRLEDVLGNHHAVAHEVDVSAPFTPPNRILAVSNNPVPVNGKSRPARNTGVYDAGKTGVLSVIPRPFAIVG